MYSRENIKLRCTTDIENIRLESAEVSPINTKINFIIKNKLETEYKNDEKELIEELLKQGKHGQEITDILVEYSKNNSNYEINRTFDNVYIENTNGKKFYQDLDLPDGNNYIVDTTDNTLNATFTFPLTKFELTQVVYLYFEYEGNQYKVELSES